MTEDSTFDCLKYDIEVTINGDKFYWNWDGELHRDEGPAEILADGTRVWRNNGKLHRLDGPAIEWCDGRIEYWIHGNFHIRGIYEL